MAGPSTTGLIRETNGDVTLYVGGAERAVFSSQFDTATMGFVTVEDELNLISSVVTLNDGAYSVTFPAADGSNGTQLTTNGSGTLSWAAAASMRELKNVLAKLGIGDAEDALRTIDETPVYKFRYKDGMGTQDSETEYVGVMADEAPWAMHYGGQVINPVNALGMAMLAIKALSAKVEQLEAKASA